MVALSSTPPLLGMGRFPATKASTEAWMRKLQAHFDAGGEVTDGGYPTRQHDAVMLGLSTGRWRIKADGKPLTKP